MRMNYSSMKKHWLTVSLALSAFVFLSPQNIVAAGSEETAPAVNEVQQDKKVSGVVRDANGEPIVGATVKVQGSRQAVITDVDGRFTIDARPGSNLEISSIGFKTMVVKAGQNVDVSMEDDNLLLNEVVAIGYGKAKKSDLSSAIGTVENMDKLQERPVSSVSQMLQGQIPGVSVVANGGHTGSEPTITIRGMGSPSGEAPLYVVDGVPGAPFNMSDVTNITVLKDAASAAIYGAYAGSAGVILVTTKQDRKSVV